MYIGGNWKMNLDRQDSVELARMLAEQLHGTSTRVTVFPPFPYLDAVSRALRDAGSTVEVGAQNCHPEPDGAFTGEVSLAMLADVGCHGVLVGHSERRHVLGESDALINAKLRAAREAKLEPLLCIGESLEQRERDQTDAINRAQLAYGLAGITAQQMERITIAYEPVWAIGTGRTATPADAQAAHAAIRAYLAFVYGQAVADAVSILYGGSVKPDNAAELFAQQDIDGALVGGASLHAADFVRIVEAATQAGGERA